MPVTCTIRDATSLDLGNILEIERASFSDAWTLGMLHAHLDGNTHGSPHVFLVAEAEVASHPILGFAIVQIVGPDAELLDIAVAPSQRGAGIGATLLGAVVSRCTNQGVTTIFLEVRESNIAARALYASYHFTLAGRRKRYYRSPTEDALILKACIPVLTGNPVKLQ